MKMIVMATPTQDSQIVARAMAGTIIALLNVFGMRQQKLAMLTVQVSIFSNMQFSSLRGPQGRGNPAKIPPRAESLGCFVGPMALLAMTIFF
jgi:hypothetical protein